MTLTIQPVADDEAAEAWRQIHNQVIPASPLTAQDVEGRRPRNLLTLAYVDGELVGNATVRPASGEGEAVTVIVRVLPQFRCHGYGSEYFDAICAHARVREASNLATVVLASNADGLVFAIHHGFHEIRRYEVDGAEYVDLVVD